MDRLFVIILSGGFVVWISRFDARFVAGKFIFVSLYKMGWFLFDVE